MKKILFSAMFAAFSLTSNATITVVVSPCEGVLNEVYHRELSYEEVKAAQERLIKKCEELENNGGNQNQQTNKDENVSTNP
ncbi:MAG: hypothetical protein MR984_02670 [Bacteroidales bacterium]|nr:hypothetical protein [Bacteroidales bacterium]